MKFTKIKAINDIILKALENKSNIENSQIKYSLNNLESIIDIADCENANFELISTNVLINKIKRNLKLYPQEIELIIEALNLVLIDYTEDIHKNLVNKSKEDFTVITKSMLLITMIIKKLRNGKQKFDRLLSNPRRIPLEELLDYSALIHLLHEESIKERDKRHIISSADDLYLKTFPKEIKKGYSRGNVLLIQFGEPIGHEFAYKHYSIVIAENNNTVVILPLTSSSKRIDPKYYYELEASANELLKKKSKALYNQIRVVSKERILSSANRKLPLELMQQIDKKLIDYLIPYYNKLHNIE